MCLLKYLSTPKFTLPGASSHGYFSLTRLSPLSFSKEDFRDYRVQNSFPAHPTSTVSFSPYPI
jgi:hypothetical protein